MLSKTCWMFTRSELMLTNSDPLLTFCLTPPFIFILNCQLSLPSTPHIIATSLLSIFLTAEKKLHTCSILNKSRLQNICHENFGELNKSNMCENLADWKRTGLPLPYCFMRFYFPNKPSVCSCVFILRKSIFWEFNLFTLIIFFLNRVFRRLKFSSFGRSHLRATLEKLTGNQSCG